MEFNKSTLAMSSHVTTPTPLHPKTFISPSQGGTPNHYKRGRTTKGSQYPISRWCYRALTPTSVILDVASHWNRQRVLIISDFDVKMITSLASNLAPPSQVPNCYAHWVFQPGA
ncbi:hypothetical protein NC653_004067 [Populus alba x Populus x berolinensis]|uniref:Uncharacterized protein n=1 Tax=Populus alba x Populus x berolinensis TaxID=444605 RepID=A0AAD6RT26_9ROSI|nr:hypothetical protein NC653_004067 [Populus alba x Populus x berolinensis]